MGKFKQLMIPPPSLHLLLFLLSGSTTTCLTKLSQIISFYFPLPLLFLFLLTVLLIMPSPTTMRWKGAPRGKSGRGIRGLFPWHDALTASVRSDFPTPLLSPPRPRRGRCWPSRDHHHDDNDQLTIIMKFMEWLHEVMTMLQAL